LIAFPITVLIAATGPRSAPPWIGLCDRGSLLSAIVTYAVGVVLGRETCGHARVAIEARAAQDRQRRRARVAAIRLVPLAPFTVVNLAAGASDVKLGTYVAGTLLGMAPGLIVMSALGISSCAS